MHKNNVKSLFNKSDGNTAELKMECSKLTGLNIRTIQSLYADSNRGIKIDTAVKLAHFFSIKMGRRVAIDEVIVCRNDDIMKSVSQIEDKIKETIG